MQVFHIWIDSCHSPAKYVKNVTFFEVNSSQTFGKNHQQEKNLPACPSASFVTKINIFFKVKLLFSAIWWNRIVVRVWTDNLWSMKRIEEMWTWTSDNWCNQEPLLLNTWTVTICQQTVSIPGNTAKANFICHFKVALTLNKSEL